LGAALAGTALVLLASLVAPHMLRNGDIARLTKAHADITAFATALVPYKADTGEYPTTAQGLRALHQKPEGVKDWAGPYIQQDIPKDPWNHDYVYYYPGEHGDEPDIICYGADGQPGGEGLNADIVSWK
jgi:general secretion pathway protein G